MKTGIFFGSTTGNTESLALSIANKLSIKKDDVHDVSSASLDETKNYDVLLLGSSTWGCGDLQDDWYGFIEKLKEENLTGIKVGLFGCGDGESYADTFCSAMGVLYDEMAQTKCTFIGTYEPSDYSPICSDAVRDGKLIGLAIDEDNESNKTEARIELWVEQIKAEI